MSNVMIVNFTIRADQLQPNDIFCEQRGDQAVVGIVKALAPNGEPVIGVLCAGNNSPYWYCADSMVRIKRMLVAHTTDRPHHRLGYG